MHQVPESNASKQRVSGGVEAPVEFEHKPGEKFFALVELKGERPRSIYKELSRVRWNGVQRASVAGDGGLRRKISLELPARDEMELGAESQFTLVNPDWWSLDYKWKWGRGAARESRAAEIFGQRVHPLNKSGEGYKCS